MIPTDPRYAAQWHLFMLGDLEAIWDDYDGSGVTVGVYDDGFEYIHEDLAANYDASLHVVDDLGNPVDPSPIAASDGHGVACAGIIGAALNGIGGVGVAHGVTLTGVNLDFDDTGLYGSVNSADVAPFLSTVGQAAVNFDISSNSWGAFPGYYASNTLLGGSFSGLVDQAYETLSAEGRLGLGTIIVQAAGNDNEDANGDGLNASRFTITVAATTEDGFAASYSQFGANILVAAPAAALTTDFTDTDVIRGYDAGSYTDRFGGTSAATPVVSGVVALMLDANANLGWRDVQNILAASARLTGSAFDAPSPATTEEGTWSANAAGTWNGGGYHVHTNYGYGMVNAYNAVRMAEVWSLFAPAQTSANEQMVTSGLNDLPDTVVPEANGTPFVTTFEIGDDLSIEHVALQLSFSAPYLLDLKILLTSAEGTEVVVVQKGPAMAAEFGSISWQFGIDSLRGELSAGTWTLQVFDTEVGDAITLRDARLDVYGAAASVDDVYHFTDEFLTMADFDTSRDTILDSNGGTDWLNFAAVTGSVVLNLAAGQFVQVAGALWAILASDFENAVTGDGDDLVTGTAEANRLHGMRGNDTLLGGQGDDRLDGGAGHDSLEGGAGNDTLTAGTGLDTLRGGEGNDVFTAMALQTGGLFDGGAGNDRMTAGRGPATMTGGTGQDTIDFSALGGDFVFLMYDGGTTLGDGATYADFEVAVMGAGNNVVFGSDADSTVFGGAGNDQISESTGNDLLHGGNGHDLLEGGAGADTLHGGKGIDTMIGGAGDDLYIVDHAGDRVFETLSPTSLQDAGGDDLVQSALTFRLDSSAGLSFVERLTLTGTAHVNAVGNDLDNTLSGNGGNNLLNGGLGHDTMLGGAGNDIYVVDALGDRVFETTTTTSLVDAGGNDLVQSAITFKLDASAGLRFVERLTLTGTAHVNGTGNGLANVMIGNDGNNLLNGGQGSDTLTGGAGSDVFVFSAAIGAGHIDRILDFDVSQDLIRLDDAIFAGLAGGVLQAAAFGANLLGQAQTAAERILYETDTGKVFFDADGQGGALRVQFATLGANLGLTHADFFVF